MRFGELRAKTQRIYLEWTNHRIAKSSRFANFVREPGFNLNSPVFSREKPPNSGEKWGLQIFSSLTRFCDVMVGPVLNLAAICVVVRAPKVFFLLRKEVVRLPKFLNSTDKLRVYKSYCRRLIKE